MSTYSPEDSLLFIHVHWKREAQKNVTKFNAAIELNNQLLVDGKYIFSSPIGNIQPQDVVSVDVGLYNTETKTKNIQITIPVSRSTFKISMIKFQPDSLYIVRYRYLLNHTCSVPSSI